MPLPTLRAWKAVGRIRYLGISHYHTSAYREIEEILRHETLDFLQINYSLAEQESARRLLPLAAERGMAVIANRPFAEGALFRTVQGKTLPAAAADHGRHSWAQLFLRWILAHPAASCAVPASNRLDHLEDNMAAAMSPLPVPDEENALARMAGFWESALATRRRRRAQPLPAQTTARRARNPTPKHRLCLYPDGHDHRSSARNVAFAARAVAAGCTSPKVR